MTMEDVERQVGKRVVEIVCLLADMQVSCAQPETSDLLEQIAALKEELHDAREHIREHHTENGV